MLSNLFRLEKLIRTYPESMGSSDEDEDQIRLGFGLRLKAAREGANGGLGYTQRDVADRFGINKATVSAWETGRGAPDAFMLRSLARLYDVSADALLWENSLTPEAMKVAAEYDSLNEKKKAAWKFVWLGFVAGAAEGGENLPLAPAPETEEKRRH